MRNLSDEEMQIVRDGLLLVMEREKNEARVAGSGGAAARRTKALALDIWRETATLRIALT